jgi:hypothetical protein
VNRERFVLWQPQSLVFGTPERLRLGFGGQLAAEVTAPASDGSERQGNGRSEQPHWANWFGVFCHGTGLHSWCVALNHQDAAAARAT